MRFSAHIEDTFSGRLHDPDQSPLDAATAVRVAERMLAQTDARRVTATAYDEETETETVLAEWMREKSDEWLQTHRI
jgi:hypothetical protein